MFEIGFFDGAGRRLVDFVEIDPRALAALLQGDHNHDSYRKITVGIVEGCPTVSVGVAAWGLKMMN